ncbi:MAG: NAD(P)H-hydrate dehydratase, partial [Actinomycetota bacterium]
AAHAAARIITEKLGGSVAGKYFLILCGKGNNGGDGAALARMLWNQGAKVQVKLFGKIEETKGDARINFEFCKRNYEEQKVKENVSFWFFQYFDKNWLMEINHEFRSRMFPNKIVIDALFGTGLTKKLEGQLAELVENSVTAKNKTTISYLVSLDIPSGIDSNVSEQIGENINADLTVSFTAPKLANVLPPASNFNGELVVANIGSPQELIDSSPSQTFVTEKQDAINWLEQTKFTSGSYKNKRGHALLIVGSREYSGAAVLAGNAAMLSGVGLTTIATSESAQVAVAAKVLEEVITHGLAETKSGAVSAKAFAKIEKLTEKIDVVGIGCGLSSGEKTTKDFVRKVVMKRKTPVVIDADGLNALSPFDLQGSDEFPLILTPHEGEFLRLLGTTDKEALKDRVKAVRDFAEKHKVILVLKGERTLIAAPDGRVCINPTGNSGLGKAGNGDTLTGIITGFIAQAVQAKVDIFETTLAAVYIAGLAGDIAAEKFGKRTMLASDVRECLGEAFESITN